MILYSCKITMHEFYNNYFYVLREERNSYQ